MLIENLSIKHLKREPLKKTNQKPPLFLLIHGYGSNEKNLFPFASSLPTYAFIISLQALHKLDYESFAWYEISFFEGKKNFNLAQALESSERISKFVDEAIHYYNLDKENVWLCGFSQGAILSYSVALNHPKKVKNILALSGFFQKEFLINAEKENKNYEHLNFFISHGLQDQIIPIEWARSGKKNLDHYKVSYLYKEYEMGHEISEENYNDLLNWINNHL